MQKTMEQLEKQYKELVTLFAEADVNFKKVQDGNKSAGVRFRKNLVAIGKKSKEVKALSVLV